MVRVLLVEDDPSQRRLLELLVRARGHEPIPCANLAEARAATGYDFALVDRRLPDGDGAEWASRLSCPAFLLTGSESEEGVRGLPLLLKPIRPADIERILPIS